MVNLWGPGAFGAARPAAVRPTFTPDNGPGDPDDWMQDCTSPTARDGTEWRSAMLNALLAQLRGVVRKSGQSDDNTDDHLLARAIRSQGLNYVATVGGTANALTATLDPAPASNASLIGAPLRLLISVSNTGAATLTVNGLAALPILTMRGAALAKGDLPAGAIVTLLPTGTAYLFAGLAYSEALLPLRSDQTFYVRSDGNDANDGLANTAGSAFQTLTGAYNAVRSRYTANGYRVTLQLGMPGTYAGLSHDSWPGTVAIVGNPAAISSHVITGFPSAPDSCVIAQGGQTLAVRGVTLLGGNMANGRCAWAFGGSLTLQDIDWKAGADTSFSPILAEAGGNVALLGAHQAYFASRCFFRVLGGASVYLGNGSTATDLVVLSSASFWTAFAEVSEVSKVMNRGMSFFGPAVGVRYDVSLNSIINTAGAGANYFPGSVAGSVATGGQYV